MEPNYRDRADMMQVLSNGRYEAPLHRVLGNAARTRYSAPFFFNPSYEAMLAPVLTPPRQGSAGAGAGGAVTGGAVTGGAGAGKPGAGAKWAAEEPVYSPLSWGEFRRRRFEGDLGDKGVPEVQISGWLVSKL